jgi:hypothetical protein
MRYALIVPDVNLLPVGNVRCGEPGQTVTETTNGGTLGRALYVDVK